MINLLLLPFYILGSIAGFISRPCLAGFFAGYNYLAIKASDDFAKCYKEVTEELEDE